MHIHKINSNSQEHRSFLSQNRKDPITGDSILESDEVVFCAGCKSVFLCDTWEYLGKRHCGQSGTLIDFPLQQAIHIKLDNEILFYKSLLTNGESLFNIPSKAKKKPWLYEENFLSAYDKFQESNINTGLFIFLVSLVSLALYFFTSNFFIFLSILVILLLLLIVGRIHDSYYIKKVNLKYKKFYSNTFYISKKTVGFVTKYGEKQYTLPVRYIEKVVFRHTGHKAKNKYFKIYYKVEGVEKTEHVTCYLSDDTFEDPFSLFDSIRFLSQNKDIQVKIESIEEDTINHLKKLNQKWSTNFSISYLLHNNLFL
ncbi:hypothetical protein [Bernardetia sp. MNP-M8]|uniref:hypothetical protein n=1 Tax=Bernardetia sp. MNP-M8 TaxID=3127470 RepID=UPI0030D51BE0